MTETTAEFRSPTALAREESPPEIQKPVKETSPVLVIAGEHSGDILGADIVSRLKHLGFQNFFGTGGEKMASAGVELIADVESMAVIGFVEAFRAYSRLKKLALSLAAMAKERGVRTAILIDYPGFNLRLAEMLKKHDIHVVQVVSPQIWAWKYGRIKRIRSFVDLVLTLFPFEREIFRLEGIDARWIGHPLVRRIGHELAGEKPIPPHDGKTIALLPGSRGGEIRRLLPVMLESALLLQERYPDARFLVPGINHDYDTWIQDEIGKAGVKNVEYLPDRSLRVMEASDLVILSSGTATMETSYFLKPMIILYRVSRLNFFIGGLLIRTRFIGMPNILARHQVAMELLQGEVEPGLILKESIRILEDGDYRESILKEMKYVKSSYGKGDPADRAARYIYEFHHNSIKKEI